jgi:hydrogenase-4 component F
MYIYLMMIILTILVLSCGISKNVNIISYLNILGMFSLVVLTIFMGIYINNSNSLNYFGNSIYIDSLSLIQLFIITTVSLITSIYSHKYIQNELGEKVISNRKARIYYFLFIIFVFSMIYLCISNNIMGMWIGLEATTLSTAFLIGFNNNKYAMEAAWKYIIICSIGIAIGLVGIILFLYSAGAGDKGNMFLWTYLMNNYKVLDKTIVKLAFTLIFVGVGTKAGFAPMHTWLSDGHSEAPSPISAMMSGILINLAIYVIVRFYTVVRLVDGAQNLKYLFIVFGCLSLIVSTFSLLKQTNYKRLLAFSSVENMGIISLGIGFGGPIGALGAILHAVIHAYGKTLLFLISGNILSAYKSKRIDKIHGLIKTMPYNSIFLILGIFVITGTPPFASFFSEFKIMISGLTSGHYIAIGIFGICLILALLGFLLAFLKMIFGFENTEYKKLSKDKENLLPIILTFAFVIFVSCTFNNLLSPILTKAVAIING